MATATLTDREQWLEERRKGIGGSDAAALFPEEAKYACPTRVWYEKRGFRPDYERTEAEKRILDRGNRFEDKVAELFAEEYGFKLRRQPTSINPDQPFMRVNIDRQIVGVTTEELLAFWPDLKLEGACGPGVLECKTSNHWVARDVVKQGIVVDYIFQVQHALAVKGYRWGVMAVLDTSSLELTCFPMVRNESLISIMKERAEKFWTLVENGPKPDAPDFPAGDARCRSCVFRKTCRGEQYLMQLAGERPDTGYVADDSFSEIAIDLKTVVEEREKAEAAEETIKLAFKERMEAAGISKLEVPSVGAKFRWTTNKPPYKWDAKALEAEAGTIGRHVAFAQWVAAQTPELLAEFQKQCPTSESLAAKYKSYGTPVRPFVPIFL